MNASEAKDLDYTIVGVCGHIDHGKTSLVAALTGVDTDTHPEEKRRGITIDLGFAAFQEEQRTIAFIDAPGHHKYIGNLLAGVSAIDVGLLVVACDQGIQEQTLEHTAILKTLGVPQLVVALSRADLVTQEERDEVQEELEVFLSDYGFEQFPIVQYSAVTRDGLEEIKREIHFAANKSSLRERERVGRFRMPIDRVLTVEGRGLVVAGTIWTGELSVGDHVQLAGTNDTFRVREIESHGRMVDSSRRGHRTAVNLVGDTQKAIRRGDELVAVETHVPSDRLVASIQLFKDVPKLSLPTTVQLHCATYSGEARVVGAKHVEGEGPQVVIIEPEVPVVVTSGQKLLLRKPYPVGAFAGGQVLAALRNCRRKNRDLLALGDTLSEAKGSANDTASLSAWLEFSRELDLSPCWCEEQMAMSVDAAKTLANALIDNQSAFQVGPLLVAPRRVEQTKSLIVKALAENAEEQDTEWMLQSTLIDRIHPAVSTGLGEYVLRAMIQEKQLVQVRDRVAIASERTALSKKQRARMEAIIKLFEATRTPPTVKAIAEQLNVNQEAVESVLRHAHHQGTILEIGNGVHLAASIFDDLTADLRTMFHNSAELTVAEIKEVWGISRKYAVPLLEYCDQHGYTIRDGDLRTTGPSL